ncbi:DUF523 domain-containing protein [Vibrio sp.]|nr:DUF523 domain-containing protein [Vibrio sp.]
MFTFCPEISAGLPFPRAPAEIENDDGLAVLNGTAAVIDKEGNNVAYEFISGALNTLEFCQERSIRYAILTESSPSCGSTMIYDGSFQGVRKRGQGVTAVLLRHHAATPGNRKRALSNAIIRLGAL